MTERSTVEVEGGARVVIVRRGNIRAEVFGADVPSWFDPALLLEGMRRAIEALPAGAEPGPTKIDFGHWQRPNRTACWFCAVSMDFIQHEVPSLA